MLTTTIVGGEECVRSPSIERVLVSEIVSGRVGRRDAQDDEREPARGEVMLTTTIVGGEECVRVAIGSPYTEEKHVKELVDKIEH
jgi:hypothetical protein